MAFALYAARNHRQKLNRIRLQKFIYLSDIVSVLFTLIPKRVNHTTYRYGPYDPAIQAAMNCLVFRGLAVADKVSDARDGRTLYEFALSKPGVSWAEEMADTGFARQQLNSSLAVAEQVQQYGWHRLKSLVYAEPTYVAMKQIGWGQELLADRAESSSSAQLFCIINHVLKAAEGKSVSVPLLIDLFFRYLDHYDTLIQGLRPEEVGD